MSDTELAGGPDRDAVRLRAYYLSVNPNFNSPRSQDEDWHVAERIETRLATLRSKAELAQVPAMEASHNNKTNNNLVFCVDCQDAVASWLVTAVNQAYPVKDDGPPARSCDWQLAQQLRTNRRRRHPNRPCPQSAACGDPRQKRQRCSGPVHGACHFERYAVDRARCGGHCSCSKVRATCGRPRRWGVGGVGRGGGQAAGRNQLHRPD